MQLKISTVITEMMSRKKPTMERRLTVQEEIELLHMLSNISSIDSHKKKKLCHTLWYSKYNKIFLPQYIDSVHHLGVEQKKKAIVTNLKLKIKQDLHVREYINIQKELELLGIRCALLKKQFLSQERDHYKRYTSDIDLLIEEKDIDKLKESQSEKFEFINPSGSAALYQVMMKEKNLGLIYDIHWHLSDKRVFKKSVRKEDYKKILVNNVEVITVSDELEFVLISSAIMRDGDYLSPKIVDLVNLIRKLEKDDILKIAKKYALYKITKLTIFIVEKIEQGKVNIFIRGYIALFRKVKILKKLIFIILKD